MEIEKFVHLNKLYSIYKKVLTDKQNMILSYYLDEDLSLGEISEEMGISRQAVHDAIKRSEQILLDYENKLGILEREEMFVEKLTAIIELASSEQGDNRRIQTDIISICKELME